MPTYKQWGFSDVVNTVTILGSGAGYWSMTAALGAVIEIDFGYKVGLKKIAFITRANGAIGSQLGATAMGDYAIVGSNTAATGTSDAYVPANGDVIVETFSDRIIGTFPDTTKSPPFDTSQLFGLAKYRYYRLVLTGPNMPTNPVYLDDIRCDVGIVAKSFGFTTKSGVIKNLVDGDVAVGWSPFSSSFNGNGGAAAFVDVITTSPTAPYAALEFDMGEVCTVKYFNFAVAGEFSLPACVLYGSNNPATSTADTLQIGDTKLGTYSVKEMNLPDIRTLPAASSDAQYRYYRFVVDPAASVPDVVTPVFWNSADKTSGVTLTNTGHTATAAAGSSQRVRGLGPPRTTGKWYFEFSSLVAASNCQFGITSSTGATAPGPGNSVYITAAGAISTIYDNYSLGFVPNGHGFDMAIDFDAQSVWIRYDGTGNWNNDSTANPATGVGGKHTLSLAAGFVPYMQQDNGGAATINTGDSAFAHAIPAGFHGWARANPIAPDGTDVLEYVPVVTFPQQWINSDYDSIWGKGDRIENGLVNDAAVSGLGTVVAPFGGTFSFTQVGGYFGTPTVGGFAAFNIARGIFLRGVEIRGSAANAQQGLWRVLGGPSPGSGVPVHSFTAFNISPGAVGSSAYHQEISFDGPGAEVPWPWYAFQVVSLPPSPGAVGRFIERLWLKVAHSSLDGGDRQNIGNTTPGKEVIVTTNFNVAAGVLNSLIDGVSSAGPDGGNTTPDNNHMVRLNTETVPGKYIQFEFPRLVAMHEMILNTQSQETYGAGPAFNPTVYGFWKWQGSSDGSNWTNVGPVWKFKAGCSFMLAPDPQPGTSGQRFLMWRMVHVSGTVFVSAPLLFEIIFNLNDPGDFDVPRRVAFSDNDDSNLSATITTTAPGDPFEGGKFTDGTSDVLNAIVTLKANPVLKLNLTDADDDALSAFSDIFPSTVVQTMLHVSGR